MESTTGFKVFWPDTKCPLLVAQAMFRLAALGCCTAAIRLTDSTAQVKVSGMATVAVGCRVSMPICTKSDAAQPLLAKAALRV